MNISLSELKTYLGKEFGSSRWYVINQERIDTFADTTEDWQFIHVDPDKSKDTPFGGTIAHGFLTLSMLSAMAVDTLPQIEGRTHSVNYGFNRIRFVSPVAAGARIRARFELAEITEGEGFVAQILNVTVEIENSDKPAMVAEWVSRHYFS